MHDLTYDLTRLAERHREGLSEGAQHLFADLRLFEHRELLRHVERQIVFGISNCRTK